MATVKKATNKNTKQIKKVEDNVEKIEKNISKAEQLRNDTNIQSESKAIENNEQKKDIESEEILVLKAQLKQLQEMMSIMSQNSQPQVVASKIIKLGSRSINGSGLVSEDRTVQVNVPYNKEVALSEAEIRNLIRKPQIRRLLENGILYFTEEENYRIADIYNYQDLSDERIMEICSQPVLNDIIRDLSILSKNKADGAVENNLIYRISNMIRAGKLANLSYEVRAGLESYFGVVFANCIQQLEHLEELRR